MGYEKIDGVYKYSESLSKEAVAWQGYDNFPGVDKYENRVLNAGTVLVKLHGSKSGYFTTLDTYERLKNNDGKVSSIELSEGLQVAPWENKKEKQYEYRSKVSFARLTEDIEVAYGEKTLANSEYGKGVFKQVFIAGYDGENIDNNKKFGLETITKNNEIKTEDLVDNVISKAQWKLIQRKHEQHLWKRNLFCYQKSKDDFMTLMVETKDDKVKEYCREQINEVDEYIDKYTKNIARSVKGIGNVKSPTYDEKNIYISEKTNNQELRNEYLKSSKGDLEKQVKDIHENIMKKVEGDMNKPIDQRNIDVDELLKAYDTYKFCELSNEIIKQEKQFSTIDENTEKIRKLDSELHKKEEMILKAKRNLEIIDKYKDVAYNYDNKKLFKKSYQKNHQYEKNLYDKSENDLNALGITNWKEYNLEKKKLEELKPNIDNYRRALKSSIPSRIEQFKKLAQLKNKQLGIIKNSNIINKTKMISRKPKLSMER